MFGITAQQLFSLLHQIIHPACYLHGRDRGDHRHDDRDYVERDSSRFNAYQGEHQNAKPARETNADAA
ncbi:hypothetical protein SRABI106_04333 [Rahnella aquatilis]|nr:hypothetical protein SRABI106_04333 [Rahnella aquatilis]